MASLPEAQLAPRRPLARQEQAGLRCPRRLRALARALAHGSAPQRTPLIRSSHPIDTPGERNDESTWYLTHVGKL